MSKLLLTIAAAFLFNSTMAQAEVKTFNFTWSGANFFVNDQDFSNTATATGFITLDTNFITSEPFFGIVPYTDLGITVTGSVSGNGNFTESDFGNISFYSSTPLDFSRELVGQNLTERGSFGTFDNFNDGFNVSRANGNEFAPYARWFNEMTTSAGERMNLISMSVAAVPEGDTSAMLLMGAGVMGFIARRRKNSQA